MYTCHNYQTKKALIADVKAGKQVETFQPGGMFPAKRDGSVCIEGPHFPQPHKWYASAVIQNGIIVKVN